MRGTAGTLAALLAAIGPGTAVGGAVRSTAEDRKGIAVTVYNDGRGLVREERVMELPAGATEVRFVDVAEKVEAPTVRVSVLEGLRLSVLEQNYEYDLLSPRTLLDKFVGQTITLVRQKLKDDSTVEEEVPAKLLSTNDGAVWEIEGKIVSQPAYVRILFPNVPQNLVSRPTLVWLVDAPAAGRRRLETSYLTGGMSWRADYVLSLDAAEEQAALLGWVTVDNKSGSGYGEAQLKLVAGDVRRAPPEQRTDTTLTRRQMAATASAMQEEELFEYHLYTLPRRTTLKQNQTKQVQLLDAPAFSVGKDYVVHGAARYYREAWNARGPKDKVRVLVKFRNSEAAGLGLPLPKGIVRVYKRDTAGSQQFIGEDRIEHTPKDEEMALELGNAFDIAAERRQTDFKRIGASVSESAWEIKIRNHKKSPVVVRVIEPVWGDWTMIEHSHPFKKTAAFEVEFQIPVVPDEEATLTYRVRVTH